MLMNPHVTATVVVEYNRYRLTERECHFSVVCFVQCHSSKPSGQYWCNINRARLIDQNVSVCNQPYLFVENVERFASADFDNHFTHWGYVWHLHFSVRLGVAQKWQNKQ